MSRHFGPADLPDIIPVFPLQDALLLPRGRLPLNIFEPRYLAMMDDVLKTSDRLIGLTQPANSDAADGGFIIPGNDTPLRGVGCAGRVVSFSETEDGRYLIVLAGISRFELGEEVEGFTPYRRVRPNWTKFARDLGPEEVDPYFDRERFLNLLKRYFEASGLSTDWESLEEADEETLVNSLAMLCPYTDEEKQALLEAETLSDRRASLTTLMEFTLAAPADDSALQ
ncbi:MAG: LON peptidase substrate-binding domain-containing protein [Pikeienuella sp.]